MEKINILYNYIMSNFKTHRGSKSFTLSLINKTCSFVHGLKFSQQRMLGWFSRPFVAVV